MSDYCTQSHDVGAFWRTWLFGHERHDDEVQAVEFADFSTTIRHTLYRAGFTCRMHVATCPDWLLLTVPNLGKGSLRILRAAIPFQAYGGGIRCPGVRVEEQRRRAAMQQRRKQAG